MTEFYLFIALVTGLLLAIGLLSNPIERWWVSEPLLAFVLGIATGPDLLHLFSPATWIVGRDTLLEQSARLSLAVGLMAIGLRLPRGYFQQHIKSMAVVLLVLMVLMWLVTSAILYFAFSISLLTALLLGGALTPTDPVLASSIVTGEAAHTNIPGRIRHLISGEAGANDGLAYPLVMVSVIFMSQSAGSDLLHWLLYAVGWQVISVSVIAGVVGHVSGKLFAHAVERHMVSETHSYAFVLALSLAILATARLIKTDGILAVFVASIAFHRAFGDRERERISNDVQEAINRFFLLPTFFFFGLYLPWREWMALGWSGVFAVLGILAFRRLPAAWALYRLLPDLKDRRDASLYGWFGPIGASALFYVMLGLRKTGAHELWTHGSLVIAASVVVYGISSSPLSKLYHNSAGERSR